MNLSSAHLTPPSDADLLRGAADDLRHAASKVARVSENGLFHQTKTNMLMNWNLDEMRLGDAAEQLGRKQAVEISRIVPT